MDKEVRFRIKIDDNGTFHNVTMSADELSKAVNVVRRSAEEARMSIISWSQVAQTVGNVQQVMSEIEGVVNDLSRAYAVQVEAETKLQTVMRQRMGANDEMVQAVKNLCAAQQELGVVGDEVQLMGAQQMATFLSEKQSLDVLIPAMNNLIAQQDGLNATTQSAASIGNMMGKAMQGQVDVLQRVGITFTEAQKEVLKYGNEQQRAAMLAQVITDNVGQMNQALAHTDAGKQQQLANTLGDVKEKAGEAVRSIAPFVTVGHTLLQAAASAAKLATSIKVVNDAASLLHIRQAMLAVNTRMVATAQRLLSASMGVTAVSTTSLRVAVVGLYAALTGGLYLAVEGLIALWTSLTNAQDKASDSMDQASQRQEQMRMALEGERSALEQSRAQMEIHINTLRDFHGSKEKEKALVDQMNATYGETMGVYGSVKQWYEALTANSKAYCRQLEIEARMRTLANGIATREQEIHDIIYDETGRRRMYSTQNQTREERVAVGGGSMAGTATTTVRVEVQGTSDMDKAKARIREAKDELASMRQQMEQLSGELSGLKMPMTGADSARITSETAVQKEDTTHITEQRRIQQRIMEDTLRMAREGLKEEMAVQDDLIASRTGQNDRMEVSAPELRKLDTMAALDDAITRYEEQLRHATATELTGIQQTIDRLQQKRAAMDQIAGIPQMERDTRRMQGMSGDRLRMELDMVGLEGVQQKLRSLKGMLEDTMSPMDGMQRDAVRRMAEQWATYERMLRRSQVTMKGAWGTVRNLGSSMEGITDAVKGNGSAWQRVTRMVDSALGVYDGVKGVVELIQLLTLSSKAHAAIKLVEAGAETQEAASMTAASTAAIAASTATAAALGPEASAWSAVAAAKTFAAHASIPFAGMGIASGMIAEQQAIIAAAAIPKFADGGLVYGPTLGLVGEYADASRNPEVIAPLDKLRDLMADSEAKGGKVAIQLRLKGRDLVGAISNETNLTTRRINIRKG